MSEVPGAPAVAVAAGPSSGTKKKSATAKISSHPTYAEMIQQSLVTLQVLASNKCHVLQSD